MNNSIHSRENVNNNIQVMFYKTTEKPVYFSVKSYLIKIIILSLICISVSTGFIYYNNSKLNSIISKKDMEISSLKYENHLRKQENSELNNIAVSYTHLTLPTKR